MWIGSCGLVLASPLAAMETEAKAETADESVAACFQAIADEDLDTLYFLLWDDYKSKEETHNYCQEHLGTEWEAFPLHICDAISEYLCVRRTFNGVGDKRKRQLLHLACSNCTENSPAMAGSCQLGVPFGTILI